MNEKMIILKRIFSEILFGYSIYSYKNLKYKIEHLTPKEDMELDFYYLRIEEEARKKRYPTEKEKLEEIIKDNIWTKQNDDKIFEYRETLKGIKKTKEKIFQKVLLDQLDKEEKETTEKLAELESERNSLIYPTRESYVSKRMNDYYIYLSSKRMDDTLFFSSFAEFDEADDDLIEILRKNFRDMYDRFSFDNIRKISVAPFFLESYMCCDDNPFIFYGKSVRELSAFQVLLFNVAKKHKRLIQDSKIDIPEEYFDDPEELVKFITKSKNEQEEIGKNKFKNAGVIKETDDGDFNRRLRNAAKQKGGELTMEEFARLQAG